MVPPVQEVLGVARRAYGGETHQLTFLHFPSEKIKMMIPVHVWTGACTSNPVATSSQDLFHDAQALMRVLLSGSTEGPLGPSAIVFLELWSCEHSWRSCLALAEHGRSANAGDGS